MRRLMLVTVTVLVSGCLSRYTQANDLAKEGKYVEAAELFEQLVREKPQDAELPQLLERARLKAVDQALGRARVARLTGDKPTAQKAFADGLSLREKWNVKLDGALETTVNEEREDFAAYIKQRVYPLVQKNEALSAEQQLLQHQFLLRHVEVNRLQDELSKATIDSGKASCGKLRSQAGADKPYFSALVAKYCEHFQGDAPREWPLLDTVGKVTVASTVRGGNSGLSGALDGALQRELERSPWFSDKSATVAEIRADGVVSQNQTEMPVRQQAGWTEQVPYKVNVTKTLSEKVPVNECTTSEESVPASQGGGKRQVVKQVTNEKTKTREVVVEETRFRDVPRVFEYQAVRVERRATYSVRIDLMANGQAVAHAGYENGYSRSGLWHDVTFTPANVRPERPDLGSAEAFWAAQTDEATARFQQALRDGWRAKFCGPALSPEEAARCVRVGDAVPASAVQALAPLMGADASHAATLFAKVPAR